MQISLLFYGTVVLLLSGNLAEEYEETDYDEKCMPVLMHMRGCYMKNHLPKDCTDSSKSEFTECAEEALKLISDCKDPAALKLISQFVQNFQNSDKVLCQDDTLAEINQTRCQNIAKHIVSEMNLVAEGLITEDGCKKSKTMSYITVRMYEIHGCNSALKKYVDDLYSLSACASVTIDSPPEEDMEENTYTIKNMLGCWIDHRKDNPQCDSTEKPKRLACIEGVNVTVLDNPILKHIATRYVDVTDGTEKAICKNKDILEVYTGTRTCNLYLQNTEYNLVAQGNGFYTKDGCRATYYDERYKLGLIWEGCLPAVKKYRKEMIDYAPCVKKPAA